MEKQTVFIKRYPSKGELPTKVYEYLTNNGLRNYYCGVFEDGNTDTIDYKVEWWIEEIELPSEEDIKKNAAYIAAVSNAGAEGFEKGVNFILNKLKGETK